MKKHKQFVTAKGDKNNTPHILYNFRFSKEEARALAKNRQIFVTIPSPQDPGLEIYGVNPVGEWFETMDIGGVISHTLNYRDLSIIVTITRKWVHSKAKIRMISIHINNECSQSGEIKDSVMRGRGWLKAFLENAEKEYKVWKSEN